MKLFDFETPTGSKGNLANPQDVLKGVMGVVAMILFLAVGQQVAKKVDSVLPGNTSDIGSFTKAQAVETKQGSVIV